jgi:predicted nucleotidyltransferase
MKSVDMLAQVASLLEPLGLRVVFIGGATVGLHLDALRASLGRTTLDVDCVVPAASRAEYDAIQAQLDALGIWPCMDEDAPICRRKAGDLIIDVLPRDVTLIGMRGGFLATGYDRAMEVELPNGTRIHVLRPADLMAAKVEAWHDRGRGDWMASADLEDLLSLVEGLPDFGVVATQADPKVQTCLSAWAREMLAHPDLDTLLEGNVVGSQRAGRIARMQARLQGLAAGG